jgi:hypothetical protein
LTLQALAGFCACTFPVIRRSARRGTATGFAAQLAAFLAAAVLADTSPAPKRRASLIRALVPLAAPSPTTLDRTLARLALALPESDLAPILPELADIAVRGIVYDQIDPQDNPAMQA